MRRRWASLMNILLLTHDSPFPSESGDALRNYGLLRGLCAAGHKLTLLSFTQSELDPATNPLFQHCHEVHTVPLPRHSPFKRALKLISAGEADAAFRSMSAGFESRLKRLLRAGSFDVIQFSGITLGCYLPLILARKKAAGVIYDALNAEAELQRVIFDVDRRHARRWPMAFYSGLQARRLKRFEQWICRAADGVLSVSEADQRFLDQYGGASTFVVPNGVFVDDYVPAATLQRESNQLVFIGKMDYRPNVDAMEWFSAKVLPRVRRRWPAAELVIVGRNPHRRVQALAKAARIQVTGRVDSALPYLHRAALAVVPLRMGSGTRLKILEAMAAGCAVVSSSVGAAGLHDDIWQAIEIADGEVDFAQAVLSLLEDDSRRQALGQQARRQVRAHYDWGAIMPKLLGAYRDIGLG